MASKLAGSSLTRFGTPLLKVSVDVAVRCQLRWSGGGTALLGGDRNR